MMVPKLRFSRGLKAKAPSAATACVPSLALLVKIFTCPSTERKKQRWWRWRIFFFWPSRVVQVYDSYFTSVLTQRSRFQVLLTADWQHFSCDNACTFIPTIPRRTRAFTVSWNIAVFVHSNFASSVVTRRPRHQFPLQVNLHRQSRRPHFEQDETISLLDRCRRESHQTYSLYQLVADLGTSTTLFPAIWTKPREA